MPYFLGLRPFTPLFIASLRPLLVRSAPFLGKISFYMAIIFSTKTESCEKIELLSAYLRTNVHTTLIRLENLFKSSGDQSGVRRNW